MKIWTKAFWKDAVERLGSTFFETLLGAMIAASAFSALSHWSFWEPLLWTTVVAMVKVIAAGFISPNTGASLGTTHPVDITKAIVTQTDITTDAQNEVVANAGETVAGKAATQQTNTPVDVTEAGPSPYSPSP